MEDYSSLKKSPTLHNPYASECIVALSQNTKCDSEYSERVPEHSARAPEHSDRVPEHSERILEHSGRISKQPKHIHKQQSRSQRLSCQAILDIIDATWLSMLGVSTSMTQ